MLVHSSDADMGRGFQSGTNSGAKRWDVSAAASRQVDFSIRTGKVYDDDVNDSEEEESTTPTAREARISERLPCPPAPRKKRASLGCGSSNKREFFCPPDLETVFTRRRQQPAK